MLKRFLMRFNKFWFDKSYEFDKSFSKSWLVGSSIVFAIALPSMSWAKASLESRIDRLEQVVENQISLQRVNDLESIKQDISELRGMLEECQHNLTLLQQRQEQMFNAPVTGTKSAVSVKPKAVTVHTANNPSTPAVVARPAATAASSSSVSTAVKTSANTTVNSNAGTDQAAYDAAYSLLDQKRYQEAQIALQDFIWQYPNSNYVANAHYWLGEIYLLAWYDNKTDQLQLEQAINSFSTVVAKYPDHNKAVDCLLKLGLTEIERENWQAAKEYLTSVKTKYPDSSRAKIADARLATLQEMGLI